MRSAKTAWAVTALVIVLCAVLGCNRSLAALRGRTAGMILSGDDAGYGVATDCQDMVNVARNLMTVGKKYLPADDPLFSALEDGCLRMEGAGADAGERAQAARSIRARSEELMAELETAGDLTDKDRGYLSGFAADLASAMSRMEKDPYNDAARAFNAVEGSFPANLLGFLVGPLDCFEF